MNGLTMCFISHQVLLPRLIKRFSVNYETVHKDIPKNVCKDVRYYNISEKKFLIFKYTMNKGHTAMEEEKAEYRCFHNRNLIFIS